MRDLSATLDMPITISTELLQSFAARFIDDVRDSMNASGVTASGKFNSSLMADITPNTIVITGAAYAGAIERGRKPTSSGGNGELYRAIRRWIDDKGITPKDKISRNSLAYAITRKIHEKGTLLHYTTDYYKRTAPSKVITGVIEDGRIEKLAKSVVLDVITQIKSDIL